MSGNSVPVDYHSNQDATEADILYTFEKKLFMYERHTYNEMTYSLPTKKGKVTLVMKFAEVFLSLFRCTSLNLDKEFSTSKLAVKLSGKILM